MNYGYYIKDTVALKPGDVVLFADLVDTIESVEDDGSNVLRVNVIRKGQKTFWLAGKQSQQKVSCAPK